MSCGSCVAAVERVPSRLDGVYRTSVSVGGADVAYNPSVIGEAELNAAIEDAGYKVGGARQPPAPPAAAASQVLAPALWFECRPMSYCRLIGRHSSRSHAIVARDLR